MDTAQFPPKPDPQTGEPRPPSAPLEPGNAKPSHRRPGGRRKVPGPESGEGPLLEWFYPDRTTRVLGGLFISFLGIVVYTWKDWGFGWVGNPWLWLLLVPWPILLLMIGRNYRMAAEAEWLRYGKRSRVQLYELESVKVVVNFGGAAHTLQMKDSRGDSVSGDVNDLQQNHELWELIYNGILH